MIGFIGLSHLGLNYSLATAAKGFDVIGFDPDSALTKRCGEGNFPIEEPGFMELFNAHRTRLCFSSDITALAKCDVIFYSLDVPTDSYNRSNLEPLRKLIDLTRPHLGPKAVAVILCQVPPGFTRRLAQENSGLGAALFYQVETLIFGNAVERAMKPERYMVGCADPEAALPASYQDWLDTFGCPVLRMRYESAELAKIAINFFLVSSVTTTNTLAEVCEKVGANWAEIAPALRLDKRIGPHAYLSPGLGIAGGNLERDLVTIQTLAAEHGTEAGIVSAWMLNSRYRRDWVLRQVQKFVLAVNAKPRLAFWGLAYKQDTHSIKNSPSLALARSLEPIEKIAYDPQVKSLAEPIGNLAMAASALGACRGSDALIIMTPWREFSTIDPAVIRREMRGNILIDPFGVLKEAPCREAGFSYYKLGS